LDLDVPVIFFGTKSDQSPVKQNYSIIPDEFCKQHQIKYKITSFKKKSDDKELYSGLVQEIYDYNSESPQNKWAAILLGAGLIAIVIAGGIYAYKQIGNKGVIMKHK